MNEDIWRERAQTAEAILTTQKEAFTAASDRVRIFKKNFGIRETQNGDIQIDYEKFVRNLGIEDALALRLVIDALYKISGEAGDKPRIKIVG